MGFGAEHPRGGNLFVSGGQTFVTCQRGGQIFLTMGVKANIVQAHVGTNFHTHGGGGQTIFTPKRGLKMLFFTEGEQTL